MVENAMGIGNCQDSLFNNVMDYCQSCSKEIYFGEEYRDMDGEFIHDATDCIKQYVASHFTKKIAGE
ncbi:hypothetical protein [Bacillus sp. FSL K6-2944]|uniref:hypothetical protein n=1 Tax=Bacillus sp. FSL K6-2944 TaxID=2921486 RepID=UPI0030F8FAD1